MKTTRKLRVQLDFVVEFDSDLSSLPIGVAEDIRWLTDMLVNGFRKRKVPGAVELIPGTRCRFSLDYRK